MLGLPWGTTLGTESRHFWEALYERRLGRLLSGMTLGTESEHFWDISHRWQLGELLLGGYSVSRELAFMGSQL